MVGGGGVVVGVGVFFFFFNDTATTEIYTLSLHDALPISSMTVSIISVGFGGDSNFELIEKFAWGTYPLS